MLLSLYCERVLVDFSVRHFHEKLREEQGITYSYTCISACCKERAWCRCAESGRIAASARATDVPACCCTSTPARTVWLGGEQWHDLMVVLVDATHEIITARVVGSRNPPQALAACGSSRAARHFSALLY